MRLHIRNQRLPEPKPQEARGTQPKSSVEWSYGKCLPSLRGNSTAKCPITQLQYKYQRYGASARPLLGIMLGRYFPPKQKRLRINEMAKAGSNLEVAGASQSTCDQGDAGTAE